MAQAYFLGMILGLPLLILTIALLAGHFNQDGYAELLDWKPTRSPEREVELELGELDQMLAAQNRYRRERGLPERSLDEVSRQAWANFNRYGELLAAELETSRTNR
jgi:hypothetical protein